MRTIVPRIVIQLHGGFIQGMAYEGFEGKDIQVLVIDRDIDGSDESHIVSVGGLDAYLAVESLEPIEDEWARQVSQAYDNWALTE